MEAKMWQLPFHIFRNENMKWMIQPEDKAFIFSFVFSARIRSRFHQQALPLETPTDIVANRLRLHIVTRNNTRNNSKQYGINSEHNAVQSLQERNTING